jgi:hypothetical protein
LSHSTVLESIKEWLRGEVNTEPLAGLCNELGRRRRLALAPLRGEGNSEGEGDTIIAASSSDSLQNADNKQLLNCTAPHCTVLYCNHGLECRAVGFLPAHAIQRRHYCHRYECLLGCLHARSKVTQIHPSSTLNRTLATMPVSNNNKDNDNSSNDG